MQNKENALLKHYNESGTLPEREAELDALIARSVSLVKENDEESASALAFLCRAAKREKQKNEIIGEFSDRASLYAALSSDSPKKRKNVARLLGAFESECDSDALLSALDCESSRMVRPSLLLAVGNCGGEAARAYLSTYRVLPPKDESEKKHFREEEQALKTALDKLLPRENAVFTEPETPVLAELRAPVGLSRALCAELSDLGFAPTEGRHSRVRVTVKELESLFAARCFSELVLPLGEGVLPVPKAVARECAKGFSELFFSLHRGADTCRFRVELRGFEGDRAAFLKETAALLEHDGRLVNSVSGYDCELRLEVRPSGKALDAYLKLYTLPDTRFSYRKGALPASIHPATAAAILKYAEEYLSVNARVLDPCCGSGTLLIEREKLSPCASLTGVDIAQHAVDVARENAAAANSRAKFVHNDFLRFAATRPYDEVIANLPFGNRVGNHKKNEELYAGLVKLLPSWLRSGGIAILYTMEHTLLNRLLQNEERLTLLEKTRTEAGGLTPGIFLLSRK